jgi:pre-60S factor REI1
MLTSTTAPGKTFSSRAELAEHYKSDWHKYNLKRREAGLPLLEEADFQARWEAALALRKEKEAKAKTGTDHLKHKRAASNKNTTNNTTSMDEDASTTTEITAAKKLLPQKLMESQENPTVDPKQSLFDNHESDTLEGNVKYMSLKFGFFIPDRGRFFSDGMALRNTSLKMS